MIPLKRRGRNKQLRFHKLPMDEMKLIHHNAPKESRQSKLKIKTTVIQQKRQPSPSSFEDESSESESEKESSSSGESEDI